MYTCIPIYAIVTLLTSCLAHETEHMADMPDNDTVKHMTHERPKIHDHDEREHATAFMDKTNIERHIESYGIDVDKLGKEELITLVFKEHDKDNNRLLDGLELYHTLARTASDVYFDQWTNSYIDTEESVDHILETADVNHDGYLNYGEVRKYLAYLNAMKLEQEIVGGAGDGTVLL